MFKLKKTSVKARFRYGWCYKCQDDAQLCPDCGYCYGCCECQGGNQMPKFVVYYSYDLKDREDNYMAGDKNTFIIEADDRRLIDGKEIIAKVRRIAQDHCKKG